MTPHTQPRLTLSASSLASDTVVNAQGEELGSVKDLMIDLSDGHVAYAVLSFGGFMGLGDKLFAVPWQALAVDQKNQTLVLNADKDSLENAPGFDKDDWPDMSDTAWGARVHKHYGISY